MMFSHYPATSRRQRSLSGLRLLGIGWLWVACTSLTAGQERQPLELQPPVRMPVPGEVVRVISIRVTDGQPRFVVAARVVEEPRDKIWSVSTEPPPEIVEYFKRTARQLIADIDHICELSLRQQDKLKLAAMGDMSRVVRELREVREKYSGTALHNQHRNLTVLNDVAVINTHLDQGVLRHDSMFLMVLKSLLTPRQRSQLAEAKFAELTAAWPIELSHDQRQQLWRLVLRSHQHAPPPLVWFPKHCPGLIAELPQQELVSLLGESKANTLRRWNPR